MAARHPGDDVIAHIGGGVDADGPGGHLGDGDDVREGALRDPVMGRHDLRLDQREHRIPAAEGEEADDEEGPCELQEQEDEVGGHARFSL